MPVPWQPGSALFDHRALWKNGPAASLRVDEPYPDWSGYRALVVQLDVRGAVTCHVMVRVQDRRHDHRHEDRSNHAFKLPPGRESGNRIPMEEIRTAPMGRAMEMTANRGLVVLHAAGNPKTCFDVRWVMLET